MLQPDQLSQAAQRVAAAATCPATVIVFGSYARGDATEASDLDLVFQAPQAAGKALKAVMCLHGLEYRRTHDLEELAGQLADAGYGSSLNEAELRRLAPYAVEFRYDDEAPALLTGAQARAMVETLLAWAETHTRAWPSRAAVIAPHLCWRGAPP